MSHFLIFLVLALSQGSPNSSPSWPGAIQTSAQSKRLLSRVHRGTERPLSVGKASSITSRSADTEELPPVVKQYLQAQNQKFNESLIAASAQLKAEHFPQAWNILEGYVSDPDNLGRSALAEVLADSYLVKGQAAQAYAVLAPFCDLSADPDLLLGASVAAARSGLVFEGQRSFVVSFIIARYPKLRDSADNFPQGNEPRSVEAVSCLAAGLQPRIASDIFPTYYLEEALRLDPGNPLASYELGSYQLNHDQFSQAVETFKAGESRADPWLKNRILELKRQAEYLHLRLGG